ncbi:MAG: hypothetical protein K2P81_15235 [Bacteriovoracaceae bacterium]|nr:hypothetical protein [Bacteriovoracaceae bacterium]
MKKWIALFATVLGLGILFLTQNRDQNDSSPKKSLSATKSIRSMKASLQEKITHQSQEKINDPLNECDDLFEKLSLITFDELKDSINSIENSVESNCRNQMSEKLQPMLKMLMASCKPGEKFSAKDCEQFYTLLRSRAIATRMDKKLALEKWTESELMNSILWNFVEQPHPGKDNLAYNLKLINELLARVPDSYAASKAKFVHLLLQELLHKDISGSEELEATWRNLMEYGAEESLRYFPILKPMMRGDMKSFNQQVKIWQQNNPQDPMGYYYGAYASWKGENRNSTLNLLQKALSLDPNNEQIKNSLQAAKKGRFSDPIFTLNFGFSFDEI